MSDELKPCKRCGKKGIAESHSYPDGTTDYWIYCINEYCHEETPYYDTPEDAAKEWNKPSEEQILYAEVERLKGIIRTAENFVQEWSRETIRVCCDSKPGEEHETDCPFYQWEAVSDE